MKNVLAKVGVWAFIIGMVLALIGGFIGPWSVPVLVVIGVIVGLLNVSDKEIKPFLFATVALMIALYTAGGTVAANLTTLGMVGTYLLGVMGSINVFVFPATVVVAVKAIYNLAKD